MQSSATHICNLDCPSRWGLPAEIVTDLGARLHRFWQRFRRCFATRTRDSSALAHDYLRAQLTIERGRNFANIERRLNGGDGQRLQHFMSYSPWSGSAVFEQIRREIVTTPELCEGGTLILDECADEKAGRDSAGVSRQYNGRMGKVDLCRVDTCLIYANLSRRLWTMVDGELFLARRWFSEEYRSRREQTGIPAEREFATKLELGLQMIGRCRASGISFDIVACDSLYGRDQFFRSALHAAGITYAAQIPSSTLVCIDKATSARASTAATRACEVRELAISERTRWQRITLRYSERGLLRADFAFISVHAAAEGRQTIPTTEAEWLVIRRINEPRRYSYTLINAPAETPIERLAEWSTRRYFVERTFQDAKDELGWAEFEARKYRAWEHHLALTAAALWFAAQTKLDWASECRRDVRISLEMGVPALPALSTANLRDLLRAVLPLAQLTPAEAALSVVERLVRRARSISSRLRTQTGRIDSS
jgi:SRSO17 transposase